jgi:putative acetyltransferase
MTNSETLLIRPEQSGDALAIADINDRAFGGSDESKLVDAIRRSAHPVISLVAEIAGVSVGHILFSPVSIDVPNPPVALGLAPMAVLPERQRQGIGSKLIEAGLNECRRRGCEVVIVLGHTQFYPRFGFRPARLLGLQTEYADAGDAFMAIELKEGVLAGRTGLARYLPEFASVGE